jgi:hypothetical protein
MNKAGRRPALFERRAAGRRSILHRLALLVLVLLFFLLVLLGRLGIPRRLSDFGPRLAQLRKSWLGATPASAAFAASMPIAARALTAAFMVFLDKWTKPLG